MQASLICGIGAVAEIRGDGLDERRNETRNRYAVNEYATIEMK